jgi:serine/threonine protein kinase
LKAKALPPLECTKQIIQSFIHLLPSYHLCTHGFEYRLTRKLRLIKLGGCTFANQYMMIKYLGRGANGKVFLVMDVTDRRLYALKVVKRAGAISSAAPSTDNLAAADAASAAVDIKEKEKQEWVKARRPRDPEAGLKREIEAMRRVAGHNNVVRLREVIDDPDSRKVVLALDYLEGGPLMTREALERGHRVPEDVARVYFRDIAAGLAHLHACRVAHGDLKPENALMGADGRVALSDFGSSRLLGSSASAAGDAPRGRCAGTPAFLAPEMMSPGAQCSPLAADVYSLGACLYALVFGRIPFTGQTVAELFIEAREQPLRFPEESTASEELKDLLRALLQKDPERRASLAAAMCHTWTTAGGKYLLRRGSSSGGATDALRGADWVRGMLSPGLPVQTFAPGERMVRQWDRGETFFFFFACLLFSFVFVFLGCLFACIYMRSDDVSVCQR